LFKAITPQNDPDCHSVPLTGLLNSTNRRSAKKDSFGMTLSGDISRCQWINI